MTKKTSGVEDRLGFRINHNTAFINSRCLARDEIIDERANGYLAQIFVDTVGYTSTLYRSLLIL